jgi:hypothetical protein
VIEGSLGCTGSLLWTSISFIITLPRSGVSWLPMELAHGGSQGAEQVQLSLVSALCHKGERRARLAHGLQIGTVQQRAEVHTVLRTRAVVARQHFQGNEVSNPCDRYREAGHSFYLVGRGDDLGLDTGRGKEQVDDRAEWTFVGRHQADGRQTPHRGLFDGGDDPPAADLQRTNEGLGVRIVGDEHREVGVPREPRLGTDRNSQAAYEGELATESPQVGDDTTESGLGAIQSRDGGQEMGRPQASPCSAPGRV